MGIFQNSGGGFSQIPLTLYILQEKLPQNGHKKRADWVKIPIWGGRGEGFPYYFLAPSGALVFIMVY